MRSKKKVCYVVSHLHKSMGFEWTAAGLKENYDLLFVLLNPAESALESFLKTNGIKVVRINYRGKSDLLLAFLRLCSLFLRERPAIVHTHLLEATLIGISAAWVTMIPKRIYTRHNSTFHHMYFPGAVKYDRWINRLSTHIVSISQATDNVLLHMENVHSAKLRRIPHGFDLSEFAFVGQDRVERVKEKWKIPEHGPRVGVVARHMEWKGIQFIIPAFKKFLTTYPQACIIFANASGPYHEVIVESLKGVPAGHVVQIPFEEDIAALYKLFDMHVHTPIDSTCEAFGQTYVEALAAGVPSVFTLSGIAAEFIEDGRNALVVDFKNEGQIGSALHRLWADPSLRGALAEKGKQSVESEFTVSLMLQRLNTMYNE